MRRITAELQPAQAVAQRMQALQVDLQRARQHLRRERRGHGGVTDRWGLEQAGTAPQDEDWLITYLDMITLLMVAMIVMLAFAGPISKQIKAAAHRESTATEAAPLAALDPPRPAAAVQIPAPEGPAPYPAATAEEFERSALTSAPARAPLAGTFPEPAVVPVPSATTPFHAPPTQTPEPALPGTGARRPAGAPGTEAASGEAPFSQKDIALSTRLDSARVAGMRSRTASAALAPEVAPADAPRSPAIPIHNVPIDTPATPPASGGSPSEGEAMAASLPLAELGKDVEVIVNKRSVSFRVNSEILFDTGQTELSREGLALLKRMARVLVSAGYDITVEGHTDSVPVRSSAPYPSNWELSSARAGSVVRYLQANGIPKSHLRAVGFADSRPIADNGTPEGRARNRRVELVVSKHHEE
ncbi:OmpA family protein [Castellaniella sp. UC4442_H9]|nr:OmpA family protein [Castellaniella sp.]